MPWQESGAICLPEKEKAGWCRLICGVDTAAGYLCAAKRVVAGLLSSCNRRGMLLMPSSSH